MGRKDRERAKAGNIFRNASSLQTKAIKAVAYGGVKKELLEGGTDKTVSRLNELNTAGVLPSSKLRSSLEKSVPKEMDKGIKKDQKNGTPITVDTLCREVKATPGFLTMTSNVGLGLTWFELQAEKAMERAGIR